MRIIFIKKNNDNSIITVYYYIMSLHIILLYDGTVFPHIAQDHTIV